MNFTIKGNPSLQATFVIILALTPLLCFWLYQTWIDFKIQTDKEYHAKYLLNRALKDRSIDEYIPKDVPPGKVYVFGKNDLRGQDLEYLPHLYGVRFDPSSATSTLSVNGLPRPKVKGILGTAFRDKEISFDENTLNVIEYDPSNGAISSGDIIYLFEK